MSSNNRSGSFIDRLQIDTDRSLPGRYDERCVTIFVRTPQYKPHFATHSHSHTLPYVCIVLEGVSVQRSAREEREREPGRTYFYPAGELHSEQFGARGGRLFAVDFATDRPLPQQSSELVGAAALVVRRMQVEAIASDSAAPLAMESLAGLLTAMLTREHVADGGLRWISIVRDYLHASYRRKVSLGDIAAVAGVHPVHVSRMFPRRFGVTVGDYVRALRIDRAARELVSTGRPIATIALDAGFASQAHFTTHFKARLGMTPAAYRTRS